MERKSLGKEYKIPKGWIFLLCTLQKEHMLSILYINYPKPPRACRTIIELQVRILNFSDCNTVGLAGK